jgi:hypothetical protein
MGISDVERIEKLDMEWNLKKKSWKKKFAKKKANCKRKIHQ